MDDRTSFQSYNQRERNCLDHLVTCTTKMYWAVQYRVLEEQLNDEFRNEYSLQHIISVIKSMRMGLDVYVACMRGSVHMKL
jgi:hypothetical protein